MGSEMCIRDRHPISDAMSAPHDPSPFSYKQQANGMGLEVHVVTNGANVGPAMTGPAVEEAIAGTGGEMTAQEAKAAQRKALLPFAIISLSYLLYTMTDGSVRMIVLLHAYNKSCLLYTSDAADDTPCVDLGGRRMIKKK